MNANKLRQFKPYTNTHRITVPGRDTCDGSCEMWAGCQCINKRDPLDISLLPHGLDAQRRYPTRQWPDTVPTDRAPLVQPQELRWRARGMRTLCALCLGSWIVPVTLLALVSRCSG